MGLFEDEEFIEEAGNPYLSDVSKGKGLIKTLISSEGGGMPSSDFDIVLQEKIFPIIAELKLRNEVEIYRTLQKIAERSREQQKIKILENKNIVGIGGKFSAGKSCFINSITEACLPEGQKPTTAIATYIVRSEKAKNVAITNTDVCIEIDDDAVEAVAHEFYEEYQIGFSKLLKNLVVYSPEFAYSNIAILDTPGYSKSDIGKKEAGTDAEIARRQLKTADYLIWLVDANQGTITQRDLDFINSLNMKNEILVVFTKAGQRTESDLNKIVKEAKKVLENTNCKVFDVIAYDSFDKREIINAGSLEKFLRLINQEKTENQGLEQQLRMVKDQLDEQLKVLIDDLQKQNKKLSKILSETMNVEHISSVIEEYIRNKVYLDTVKKYRVEVTANMDQIIGFYKLQKR